MNILQMLREWSGEPHWHKQVRTYIRWMHLGDMPAVVQIEQASFAYTWTEEQILRCWRQRNCIGLVAERNEKVVGFMMYELHKAKLHATNFAVAPTCRRQGIGRQLASKLISKVFSHHRPRLTLVVRENNMRAQFFFRAMTFCVVESLPGYYEDSGEDGLLMEYRVPTTVTAEQVDRLLESIWS